MLWIILLLIIMLPAWILLSPLEFQIDTRVPVIILKWQSIVNAMLFYEDEEWWLKISVLFFSGKWNLVQLILREGKKVKKIKRIKRIKQRPGKKSKGKSRLLFKFFKILGTFQIPHWEISMSAGDNTVNAHWYWLNFFPFTGPHVRVNFVDKNYLVLVIRNKAWRIVYALIK